MSDLIEVPEGLRRFGRRQREGEAGRQWLATLPDTVAERCEAWELAPDGEVMHGDNGIAVPVRRGEQRLVLKVGWPDPALQDQVRGLRLWRGHGAVRLHDATADGSVQLLGRLDADRSLARLPLDEALPVAGRVLRRLCVTTTETFPATWHEADRYAATAARRWKALDRPLTEDHLRASVDHAAAVATVRPVTLVDRDLSYEHVLAGDDGWAVIDGQPALGSPEVQVGQLLWTRHDEVGGAGGLRACLARLVDAAGLDPDLAASWLVVRCADYLLWGLEAGFTDDPVRCRRMLEEVLD